MSTYTFFFPWVSVAPTFSFVKFLLYKHVTTENIGLSNPGLSIKITFRQLKDHKQKQKKTTQKNIKKTFTALN